MATDLPEVKKEDGIDIIDTTEKGWFSKATERMREQKAIALALMVYAFLLKNPEENFT